MRNGIVVVVEGVSTGLVGAYGSNTAVTPAIDRLAAHGLVLDQCFVDSMDLPKQLQSLWTGRHAGQMPSSDWSMWNHLIACGLDACLITDCPRTAKIAEQLGCPSVTLVEAEESTEPAEEWTSCGLMRVFVAAVEELSETHSNRIVWIHSRGLRLPWDAPIELREHFIDPEDPSPPSEACVPDFIITPETDPDEVIGWGQVAAAQVAVIDQAIDILMNAIELRDDADTWSWMVVSPGGVPLGEHGRVGWRKSDLHGVDLHGEEISCLAIVREAIEGTASEIEQEESVRAPGSRRPELCQLPDLLTTFLDSLTLNSAPVGCWGRSMLRLNSFSIPTEWPAHLQSAYIELRGDRWIRTPAWSAVFPETNPPVLFVKPDDRWEISDVSTRRSDIVERLEEVAQTFRECLTSNKRDQLPQLEDDLCNLLR